MSHPKFIHLYPTEEDGGSRLLIQECDPTPSCIGDECQFPGCSELCAGKFLLNTEPATFEEHKRIAENKGGNLVMIPSLAKMRCIDNLMRLKTNFLHGYWLGGTGAAGRYSWLNGDCVPQRFDDPRKHDDWCPGSPAYQRWSASQPDCYPSDSYCPGDGCMWVWTDGNWDDILCYEKKWGLYEIPSGGTPGDSSDITSPVPSQGQPLDIVFAIERKGHMCKQDLAGVTFLQRTKDAVTKVLDTMSIEAPSTSMAGYVGFAPFNDNLVGLLTTDLQGLSKNVTELYCQSNPSNWHDYESGLRTSVSVFDASTRPDADASTKAIIFITDNGGDSFQPCLEDGVETEAKDKGITIYTVGYETGTGVDETLTKIAKCTGGFFRRSDGTSITTEKVFDEIFREIND